MKKISLLTFLLLSLSAMALSQSYTNYPLPTNVVVLTSFSSTLDIVDNCTGMDSGCGTVHPQSEHIIQTYNWYGNSPYLNLNNTYLEGRWDSWNSGPAYHTACLTLDTFAVTNGIVNAAYERRTCNYGGGNSSSTSNTISSLNVGQGTTMGTLSCTITNSSLLTTFTLNHTSKAKLRIAGGKRYFIYTYRVFFYAYQLGGCPQPGFVPQDYGPVECTIPGQNCQGYSYGLYYFDVQYAGGGPSATLWIDVTVQAAVPFYQYTVEDPVLINVVDNPDA